MKKYILRQPIYILLCLSLILSCEKEETQDFLTQQIFNAPDIENAKAFVTNNTKLPITGINNTRSKTVNEIQTDWQNSTVKDYKESETQDVDILYTPIYLNTDANAKAFIASVEHEGNIESKLFCVIYKDNPIGDNGLSSYIFIYALDGEIEKGYNIQNGQPIPFDVNVNASNTGQTVKTMTDCNNPPTSGSFEDMLEFLEQCGGMLDEITVVAPDENTIDAGDSSGGGTISDGSLLPDIGSLNWNNDGPYNAGGGASVVNPIPLMPNLVSANPISIAMAIEAPLMSIEAQWLQNQLTNAQTQQLLQAIADFLNMNKEKDNIDSNLFANVSDNQVPNIKDEAVNFVNDYINFMINNPDSGFIIDNTVDLDDAMNFSSFQDAQNYFDNLSNNNTTLVSSVYE